MNVDWQGCSWSWDWAEDPEGIPRLVKGWTGSSRWLEPEKQENARKEHWKRYLHVFTGRKVSGKKKINKTKHIFEYDYLFALGCCSIAVASNSLRPHELQHARLPCPPLSPNVCSNSCPLSQWCSLTRSSSGSHFSFCLQSFQASGSFPMSYLFMPSGQSTGASASASVLPMNIQGWFPLGLTGLISLQSKGHSRPFSAPQLKSITSSVLNLLYGPTHICTWLL